MEIFKSELTADEMEAARIDLSKGVTKELSLQSYNAEKHESVWVMTTNSKDLDGDIVHTDGIDHKWWRDKGAIYWTHKRGGFPVGKPMWVKPETDGAHKSLILGMKHNSITPEGRMVEAMVADKFLQNGSIRFLPTERPKAIIEEESGRTTGFEFPKTLLIGFDLVDIPANLEANSRGFDEDMAEWLVSKGFEVEDVAKFADVSKGVIPYSGAKKADKGTAWSGSKARAELKAYATTDGKVDVKKYRKGFAYQSDSNADTLGSCKLPYHYVENGELVVVWGGAKAAMGAVLGARGGVDIPDGDRKKVYNVLSKAYKAFDETPPEFKEYDELEFVKMFPEAYPVESGLLREVEALKAKLSEFDEFQKSFEKVKADLFATQGAVETLVEGQKATHVKPTVKYATREDFVKDLNGEVSRAIARAKGQVQPDQLSNNKVTI